MNETLSSPSAPDPTTEVWGAPQSHEKTRGQGIAYVEKPLGEDASIIIAKSPLTETVDLDLGADVFLETEGFQEAVPVQYLPDKGERKENERIQLALECEKSGDVMRWAQHKYTKETSRQIILETANGQRLYVKGNTVYDLTLCQRTGRLQARELHDKKDLPDVVIGQPWREGPYSSSDSADQVKKVQIRGGFALPSLMTDMGPINAKYKKRDRPDPFAAADKLVEALQEGKVSNTQVATSTARAQLSEKAASQFKDIGNWAKEWLLSEDEGKLRKLANRLMNTKDSAAEQLKQARVLALNLGYSALSGSVEYARTVPGRLKEAKENWPGDQSAIPELATNLREGRQSIPQTRPQREAAAETARLKGQVDAFNEKFQDPTYVPAPADYQEMLQVAERIKVTSGEGGRVQYLLGSEQINPRAARSLLDKVRKSRWELSDEDRREVRVNRDISSKTYLLASQDPRQRRHEFLSYKEYVQAVMRRDRINTVPRDLHPQYRDYLHRLLALDAFLNGRESDQTESEQQSGRESSRPAQVGMRYLKSLLARRKAARRQNRS